MMIVQNDNPKLGIVTEDLGKSQKGYYLIYELNQLIEKLPNFPICCFRGQIDNLLLTPKFPLYQQKECWTFNGILIATDVETAYKVLTCWQATAKFFYLWNLDWQFFNTVSWSELHHAYDNDNLDLIVRSQHHHNLVTKIWKQPSYTMENFHHQILLEIIKNVYNI